MQHEKLESCACFAVVTSHALEETIYVVIKVLGVITDPHGMQSAPQATEMDAHRHPCSCASTTTCLWRRRRRTSHASASQQVSVPHVMVLFDGSLAYRQLFQASNSHPRSTGCKVTLSTCTLGTSVLALWLVEFSNLLDMCYDELLWVRADQSTMVDGNEKANMLVTGVSSSLMATLHRTA